jgi:hypothetical protein
MRDKQQRGGIDGLGIFSRKIQQEVVTGKYTLPHNNLIGSTKNITIPYNDKTRRRFARVAM